MLTQCTHFIRIDACFPVKARRTQDNTIGITLWLVLIVAIRINASNGCGVSDWCGYDSVYRFNYTSRLTAIRLAYRVRLNYEVPLFTVLRLSEFDRDLCVQ